MTGFYGNGSYGYGNYSAPNPIDISTKAAPEFSGAVSKLGDYTTLRILTGRFEFAGASSVKTLVALRGAPAADEFRGQSRPIVLSRIPATSGQSEFRGQSRTVPNPVLRNNAAAFEFRTILDLGNATDFRVLPSAFEFRGQSAVRVVVALRPQTARIEAVGAVGRLGMRPALNLTPARIEYAGATGPMRAYRLLHPQAARLEAVGAVSLRAIVALRPQAARNEFRATGRFIGWFAMAVGPGRLELASRATLSYAWSDLTAAGREPAPLWGEVGLPSGDPWQDVGATPADPWQLVPAPPAQN